MKPLMGTELNRKIFERSFAYLSKDLQNVKRDWVTHPPFTYLSILFHFASLYFYSLHSIPPILFYSILFYFILFYSILFYSILFYSILFYFILFYSILFFSILFYSILFYPTLFYFILFYFILFYSILFYSFLLYIFFFSIFFYFTLFYFTPLYFILFFPFLLTASTGQGHQLRQAPRSVASRLRTQLYQFVPGLETGARVAGSTRRSEAHGRSPSRHRGPRRLQALRCSREGCSVRLKKRRRTLASFLLSFFSAAPATDSDQ